MAASTNAVKAPNSTNAAKALNSTNVAPSHDPLLTVDVKFHVPRTKSMISVKALIDTSEKTIYLHTWITRITPLIWIPLDFTGFYWIMLDFCLSALLDYCHRWITPLCLLSLLDYTPLPAVTAGLHPAQYGFHMSGYALSHLAC